nr:retrovirus-related Pol polyprotein from transposon TNT 1-94 [Tanacetum cinerariifolium]
MACDVFWKSRLSTLNDENVLLKNQVDSVVKERENIKLEYQKFFNSIKATRTQHQNELDELIKHVNQKTYAYVDVRSQNQDLLMTISELKNKILTIKKEKNVNTKFDKSETSRTLLSVTPLPKNMAVKAKKVSNTKVNADRSTPVSSHFITKNKQSQKQSENVITKGMYRIIKEETHTLLSKAYIHVSNSTGVGSSNGVRRPKSKDTKLKNKVLKNTNAKRSSAYVQIVLNSVRIDSNKHKTKNLNEFLWTKAIDNACFAHNRSILRTWYNKTPYELIRGRKLSVYYSHVFGSFCYPTNNRDDLGKIKPKADNEDMIEIPSQQDLNNLFGPLYEEYYAPSTSEVLDNFAANTLDVEDTPLSSLIIVEDRCSVK